MPCYSQDSYNKTAKSSCTVVSGIINFARQVASFSAVMNVHKQLTSKTSGAVTDRRFA
jgi:hypothetical protein